MTPEENKEQKRLYRENNREKLKESSRLYRLNNKDEIQKRETTRKLKKYGITIQEYNNLILEQKGRCLICGRHQDEFKKKLAIDHCHETGKVRGLLCGDCNIMLGMCDDDYNILSVAIEYLESHNEPKII